MPLISNSDYNPFCLYSNAHFQTIYPSIFRKVKMQIMPGKINDADYHSIRTFEAFDNRYTATIHGFLDAKDYWSKCSCKQFFADINIPSLLINAQNDLFLGEACYPVDEAKKNPYLYLEMPKSGGHVGFVDFKTKGEYWNETRIATFTASNL